MKESSRGGFSFIQILINSCMEECKTPRINSTIRRGYEPLNTCPKLSSNFSSMDPHVKRRSFKSANNMNQIQITNVYPWTAFGAIVKESQQVGKCLGLAIIIGDDYVITSKSDQIYQKSSQIYFIPSFPQQKDQKYKVENIFPSHPYSPETILHNDLAILILNKRSYLQTKYGSLGIDFKSESQKISSKLLIAGIQSDTRKIKTLTIHQNQIQTDKSTFIYHFNSNEEIFIGSFLIEEKYGELFLIGIVTKIEDKVANGLRFNKEIYDKIKKCTFKGYQIDLSQNPIRQKELEYLKEMSMKEVIALNLCTKSYIKSQRHWGIEFFKESVDKPRSYNNNLDDNCLEFLSSASYKMLSHFSAQKNHFTSAGMKHLSKPCWNNLKKLQLNNNPIGSKGLLYLSKNKWTLLEQLTLNHTRIDNFGCQKLRKAYFPSLKDLSLKKNKIKEEGLRWLVQSDWPELRYFLIGHNELMEDGIKQILKASWPHLKVLHYESNQIRPKFGIKSKLRAYFKKVNFS